MSLDGDAHFNERKAFHTGDLSTFLSDAEGKNALKALLIRARVEVDAGKLGAEVKKPKDDVSKAAATLLASRQGKDATKVRDAARGVMESTPDADAKVVAAVTVLNTSLGAAKDDDEAVDAVDAAIAALGEIADTQDLSRGALEALALLAQAACSRRDLDDALARAESVKEWSQDSPLTQLLTAWLDLARGGEDHYRSAYYTFQEYADTATDSAAKARMAIAQAVCELQMGNYEEADATLANVLAKDADNADALANKTVLAALRGQRDDWRKTYDHLATVDATHPLVRKVTKAEADFDRLAQQYITAA